jgi:hypothetical protein
LLVLSAANLQFNAVGAPGISQEEMGAVLGAAIAIVVAQFANKENEVPELGQGNQPRSDVEDFGLTVTGAPPADSGVVNPTTASIISGILGSTSTTDAVEVSSAISTLSSGEFGAAVAATVREASAAQERNANKREAQPADEKTGETLRRVLVQPVPLPGREHEPTRDPATIPGLEPNRVFVRDGVDSVPLPTANTQPTADTHAPTSTPSPSPALPVLDDLDALLADDADDPREPSQAPTSNQSGEALVHFDDLPELPSIEGLLDDPTTDLPDEQPSEASPRSLGLDPTPALPDLDGTMLPDLDDLFLEDEPVAPTAKSVPMLPDLDDLF